MVKKIGIQKVKAVCPKCSSILEAEKSDFVFSVFTYPDKTCQRGIFYIPCPQCGTCIEEEEWEKTC